MNGVHDLGGMQGFGPVEREDRSEHRDGAHVTSVITRIGDAAHAT